MATLPSVPSSLPRRGSTFTRRCWAALLRLWGWSITGSLPDRSGLVVIAAPHTSNWDFVIAITALGAMGVRVTWIAKHTLFKWPYGRIMRALGGIPVDRRGSHGLVAQTTEEFRTNEDLVIALMPEGTRRRTTRWRTGFYHIAVGAGVPIVPAYLDYRVCRIGIGSPMEPTGDVEADLQAINEFYQPYARAGRNVELFGVPVFK